MQKRFLSLLIALSLCLSLILTASFTSNAASKSQTITTPLTTYGVAVGAKSFNLNAKAKTTLSYSTDNKSVAAVSSAGKVTVGKAGTAKIKITAKAENGYSSASKTVTVRVTARKAANGVISQNPTHSGYVYDRNSYYFIVRPTDPYIADLAVYADKIIVTRINYNAWEPKNQATVDKRAQVYKNAKKIVGKNPTKSELKKLASHNLGQTSCTPALLAGYWLYYDMDTQVSLPWIMSYTTKYKYYCGSVNCERHGLETAIKQINSEYKKAGKPEPFELIYLNGTKITKSNYKKHVYSGDILCFFYGNPDTSLGHTVLAN